MRGIRLNRLALRGFLSDLRGMALAGEKLDRAKRQDQRRKSQSREQRERRKRVAQLQAW